MGDKSTTLVWIAEARQLDDDGKPASNWKVWGRQAHETELEAYGEIGPYADMTGVEYRASRYVRAPSQKRGWMVWGRRAPRGKRGR